jgi:protein-disulfide isomerase
MSSPIRHVVTRRLAPVALWAAALLGALTLSACNKGGPAANNDDMTLGNANAKVTVIEYASVACPHCANFNNNIFPEFKTKYIDTGKVHYVFREMLVGQGGELALGASGFVLARCAGKDKYFPVIDQIFHSQESIYQSGDLRGGLLAIAQATGMSEKEFTDCVNSDQNLLAMNARSEKSVKDGVNSTPTFFINGKKAFEAVPTAEELGAAVEAAEKAAK